MCSAHRCGWGSAISRTARHRASFTHEGGAEAIEGLLRRRRYRVTRTHTGEGVTELFAERFAWSQYTTFVSHLALLLLLLGGLLTNLAGFQRTLALAEARPAAPLFDEPGVGQIFVGMGDAHRGVDAAGNIVDFHSDLLLRRGEEVVRCTATVNGPCSAFGYRFHQAAFFDDLAHLTIWGPDGRVLFDDVLDFENESTATPALTVTDADGAVVFDQSLPQMASVPGSTLGYEGDVALSELALPDAVYGVSWRTEGETLVALIDGGGNTPVELRPGEVAETGVHRIAFRGIASVPAIPVLDMPRGETVGIVNVQMPEGADGRPYLFISNIDAENVVIADGATVETGSGYRYRFGGRVDASGIDVRRDPGDTVHLGGRGHGHDRPGGDVLRAAAAAVGAGYGAADAARRDRGTHDALRARAAPHGRGARGAGCPAAGGSGRGKRLTGTRLSPTVS